MAQMAMDSAQNWLRGHISLCQFDFGFAANGNGQRQPSLVSRTIHNDDGDNGDGEERSLPCSTTIYSELK